MDVECLRRSHGPPDGGWGWMCVMGKLYCSFCTFGTASGFGVLYMELIDYFNTTREKAAWIGSLTSGMAIFSGPLSSAMISKFGLQTTVAAGTLLAFSGCFISWFATGITYLYITYGVVLGVGLYVLFVPSCLIVVQYFKERAGIANAVGSIGEGMGSIVLPPLYTYLIEQYGWRGTLLLLSGIILNCLVCAVIFIPPPYLKSSTNTSSSQVSSCRNFAGFFHDPFFVVYTVSTGLAFLGYIVPFVHLPDMAVQFDLDKYQAAYLVSIMGMANIVGRLVFGWISDFPCVNVTYLQAMSLIVCAASTVVCPHFTQFYSLAVYSAIYGTFIGVFTSLISLSTLHLVGLEHTGGALGIVISLVGVVTIAASPLAGWLFDITGSYNASFYVAASSFFLSGMLYLIVTCLHGKKKDTKTTMTISASYTNINQEINTTEALTATP